MYGVNIGSEHGDSPFIQAVKAKNLKKVKELLEHGANVDFPTIGGNSSMMIVAAMGDIDLAEILLSHGADLFKTNDIGDSAVSIIIERGDEDMINLIQERVDWSMIPAELQIKHKKSKITAMYEDGAEDLHRKGAEEGVELHGDNNDNE